MPEHDTIDDTQLMARVAKGDKDALCQLIDRWESPLGGFIYRYVQNKEATCELVQETFVHLYEARERFKSDMKFSSWLFKIASNLCKNYYRWRKRHPEDFVWDEVCESTYSPSPDTLRDQSNPADSTIRNEEIAKLAQIIAGMPHPLKVAIILHYYQDQSYKEIAATLGCSERGVETRLYRARAWLTKQLEQSEETIPKKKTSKLFAFNCFL